MKKRNENIEAEREGREGEGKREEDEGDEHVIDDKGGAGDGWVSAAGQG